MRVTDVQVAALRALLSKNLDGYDRLAPAALADGHGCDALVAGAFVEAIQRQFGPTPTHRDIVTFVAALRAGQPERADEIDVRAAEHMVRAALGQPSAIADLTNEQKLDIQTRLLVDIVEAEQLDLARLDDLLAGARVHAEGIRADPAHGSTVT